jgi:ketosteroid isomerase-like protein
VHPAEWIEAYGRAWEARDAEAAGELFTEDAIYRVHALQPPLVGRARVIDYWSSVTATQSGVRVRFGEPIVSGSRATVEWWTNLAADGAQVTLFGSLLLRFAPDGRCEELREYWNLEEGDHEPPDGWGR